MDNRKTRDWRVSRKHKPQTSKNASLCEQALWEKNSKEREGNGEGGGELRGEQAFSLFPLPSTPLDQRPVHRTHTSKFITGVPTLPFRRFFELFYSK